MDKLEQLLILILKELLPQKWFNVFLIKGFQICQLKGGGGEGDGGGGGGSWPLNPPLVSCNKDLYLKLCANLATISLL